MPLHRRITVLALASLATATACEAAPTSTTGGGAGGAPTTTATTSSATAGGCASLTETFGACSNSAAPDGGTGEPGAACATDADCKPACCPCPHGSTLYAYASCTCGRCTSVCDPSNDYRAPVCLDGGGPVTVGCLSCAQILNEALADGDQLGPLACPGPASAHWAALGACVAASCGSVCAGVVPANACVTCFVPPDSAGGCATEVAGCVGN